MPTFSSSVTPEKRISRNDMISGPGTLHHAPADSAIR
jgi:hypothetical protein